MYYAFQIKKPDNALTTRDGILQNPVLAFDSKKERQEALDLMYNTTDNNMIFATRNEVEKYFGREFFVIEGRVYDEHEATLYYNSK